MAKFEIVMPKMGEGIIEAAITKWLKREGDLLEEDDALVEIATDKVDSEIPSPTAGKLTQILFEEGAVVPVETVIAIVETEGEDVPEPVSDESNVPDKPEEDKETSAGKENARKLSENHRFYSPLVRSMARNENISPAELDNIPGTGKNGRVTKRDVLAYLENRKGTTANRSRKISADVPETTEKEEKVISSLPSVNTDSGDQVVEMDRMRRLIADHMIQSKRISAHVTSFIDVDVTSIVTWRNKVKNGFLQRNGEKITFTPVFIDAVAKALHEFPQINASVDGYKVIYRKNINIGMATALPNGNLIVPVIKNVNEKSLLGIVKAVNSLAQKARQNALVPDEIQGGTFTVTNFGSFDSLTGTPIINQPQVAILGVGAIRKKPVVLETSQGDVIAIRHIMILSLAYDHRIVDGALGGLFLKRLKEILENWDVNTEI
ncbi:2-oxo acid dehydrogenase subunit E2 [Candidatus Sulfidibacterium hydrothermale]|uniref:dihydrolipoamide acetyltransferase family protein n=1 Tax=Candidatus Sulfidibacterium hydrothermale TaxID=2875962 RepID=UPI001F0A3FA3|nr:dihydrolipoamide acetyltransferase family protein [Candidatus Sulfidibacterium hydrothermale]UBM63475.1 2-oxo acid dehydrogenase subunit E2 [Candidatus Sulfidibacterium hydrothermale]